MKWTLVPGDRLGGELWTRWRGFSLEVHLNSTTSLTWLVPMTFMYDTVNVHATSREVAVFHCIGYSFEPVWVQNWDFRLCTAQVEHDSPVPVSVVLCSSCVTNVPLTHLSDLISEIQKANYLGRSKKSDILGFDLREVLWSLSPVVWSLNAWSGSPLIPLGRLSLPPNLLSMVYAWYGLVFTLLFPLHLQVQRLPGSRGCSFRWGLPRWDTSIPVDSLPLATQVVLRSMQVVLQWNF